ncbi:MAG TPA: MlaD family protein [Solirubrobacteraceae bacterium]|nr:MlaD family protein [Solirubrobacteraceae bacterium]
MGSRLTPVLRRMRREGRSAVMLLATAVVGLAIAGYLLAQERIQWPSWLPLLGQHYYVLNAPVSAVDGILPGQGQAVTIAGVDVGEISGVRLGTNEPVVTMRLDGRYGSRIYSNATVLLRPKTGLEDMVAELDPGSPRGGHHLHSGATLSAADTLPTVDFDQTLAELDTDTRTELMDLVSGAGQALSGKGGAEFGATLRDFDPLSQDTKRASALLRLRGTELARLTDNLAKISTELGNNESAITRFIKGNAGVWSAFAAEDRNLSRTIAQLPGTLRTSDTALTRLSSLSSELHTTATRLEPAARALGPSLTELRPFLKRTTPVLSDELRPFSIAAQPTAKLLAPATEQLAQATPGLTTLAHELNAIVNELAYEPGHGQQGYLFYLPWANHDTNSALSSQDGGRPLRQSLLLYNCGTLQLMQNYLTGVSQNPTLLTILRLLDLPDYSADCRGDEPKK